MSRPFTPTSASWLNQVEIWFSILQGQSLSGTSFTSLEQLRINVSSVRHTVTVERGELVTCQVVAAPTGGSVVGPLCAPHGRPLEWVR
jgi:hypothetical protein